VNHISMAALAAAIARDGWCRMAGTVPCELLDAIVSEMREIGASAGVRNLFQRSASSIALAAHPAVRALPEALLGGHAFVVRAILFDKTADTNWKVPWHQDRTIAVRNRCDHPGFGPWSTKDGVVHVEPPASVLERMVTVRVHIDDCGPDNGPLRVLPGTHRLGRLDAPSIEHAKATIPESICTVARGGIIAFAPLLLHASSPALVPEHRRVVHLEFAADPLPEGLDWARAG